MLDDEGKMENLTEDLESSSNPRTRKEEFMINISKEISDASSSE
jgi:hypothetical protein